MTDKKFTDEEIKKALECHAKRRCWDNCPNATEERQRLNRPCSQMIAEDALDLINRYEAEIERLEKNLDEKNEEIDKVYDELADSVEITAVIKSEAIKEFAERLTHTLVINNEENDVYFDFAYTLETIDAVKKEVMEGNC